MQAQQSTQSTVNNKKTATTKGGKKNASKTEVQTNTAVEQPVVQSTTPAPVVQQVAPVATPAPTTTTQSTAPATTTEVEVQEFDFNTLFDFMNTTSDKFTEFTKVFKDSVLTKEERGKVESSLKRLNKSYSTLQTSYSEYLSRQVSSLEKNSSKQSGGAKKVTDKEKAAIHKKLVVHPFLLNFMKLPAGTLVSRSDALTAITGFVKEERNNNNPDIAVPNDKKSFNIIGEMKTLFNGIEQVMKSKGLLEGKTMPTQIKFTQIMQYMTHCFPKSETTTTATIV